jgi:hypothetical protein
MPEAIHWCCLGLESLFANFGLRGFDGLFRRDLGINRFLLQFRTVDSGKELTVRAPADLAVSLAGQTGMRFCPWCGVELELFYRDQMGFFPKHQELGAEGRLQAEIVPVRGGAG